jgi:hypothetical protein
MKDDEPLLQEEQTLDCHGAVRRNLSVGRDVVSMRARWRYTDHQQPGDQ